MPPRRDPTTTAQRAAQVRAAGIAPFSAPAQMGSAVGSKDFGIDLRDRPPPSSIMGSGSIEQSPGFRDFLAETGRSATNPYGNESTFQKLTGLKNLNYLQPDVPGGLTLEGIARLNRLAYDKFMNPYAQRDVLGNTDLGGDMLRGKVRSGIRPGTLTRYGMTEAAPSRGGIFAGLASLIPGVGAAMNLNRPVLLPFDMVDRSGVPGYDESKLAQLQRLSPEIGTDSVGELPTLSQLLEDDTAGGSPVATDLGAPTFQGRPDLDSTIKTAPTSANVYPSDRTMIDPEMEQSVQTTDGFAPVQTEFQRQGLKI